MAETTRTVGELAAESGLSVRVLRHWDALGIVSPDRTSQGHRRYGPDHVVRLRRAMELRQAGLGLHQIGVLLDDPTSPELLEQYVHGYRPAEVARLADQADALVDLLHDDTCFAAGERVLEMGCGVGAQTVTLAARSPNTHFVAADVSTDSINLAAKRVADAGLTNVEFVEADVVAEPRVFAEASFDHVFVCFVLEHLADPAGALQRIRRLIRPGGTITVIEGDHGSTYFHPDDAAARSVVACQVTLQRLAAGDALIGRRLYPLLTEAGWTDTVVNPRTVYVDGARPDLDDSFTRRTFTAMIAGVREPALAAGLVDETTFDAGLRALMRTAEADGVFCYTFFKAVATAADAR